MIQWNLSKETARTLIVFMNHFYVSSVDLDAITDEIQKKDLEISYLKSCNDLQSITEEEETNFLAAFNELREMAIKEYNEAITPNELVDPVIS
jgi:hypothetical protein